MSAFENRFNEIFASGRIGQPGYPSQAKTEAEHKITHLTRQLEIAREALFKARHRLLKEGFSPEDPTVKRVIEALSQLDKGDA